MRKKIFITGASSFLGRELLEKLSQSHDITVLAYSKKFDIPKEKNIKIIYGGLENINDWKSNLLDVNIIIHLAAITHTKNIPLYKKINSIGTLELALAAKYYNAEHFIFVSSRAVGLCCGEYGESKELAEQYLKNSGLPYTILRVGEAYDGSFNTKEGLGNIAALIDKSFAIPYLASKNVTLSPIHKDDVKNAILSVINNTKTLFKTYTLCGPENLSFKEILLRICEYKKVKRFLLPIPIFLVRFGFFILSQLNKTTPDQLQRLLCKKEPLSKNVSEDLNIKPRPFLAV